MIFAPTDVNSQAPQFLTDAASMQRLLQQAPVAMVILTGADFIITAINNEQLRHWGRTEEEVLNQPLFSVFPEAAEQSFVQKLQAVYKTGKWLKEQEKHIRFQSKGRVGDEAWFDITCEPMFGADNAVDGIIMFSNEVTAKIVAAKRVEEKPSETTQHLKKSNRENEEKYGGLLQNINQGFCLIEVIFDAQNIPVDYKFLEINALFEHQTGLKNAAGKTAREVVPNLEPQWYRMYGEVALTGKSVKFTERSAAMGGLFDVHVYKVGGADSKKVALLFTDITNKNTAEEELKRTTALLTAIGNSSPDMMYAKDEEGRLLYANPAVQQVIGVPWEELLGHNEKDWGHSAEEVAAIAANDRKVMEGRMPVEIEETFTGTDGVTRHFRTVKAPLMDDKGHVIGLVGLSGDITKRREAEEALRQSEALFRSLIEEAPIATCLFVGPELKIEIANEKIIAIMGKGRSVMGKPLAEALPELKGQPFLTELNKVFTTGKTFEANTVPGEIAVDGKLKTFYFNYIFKPIKNAAGEVYAILDMTIDVTEHVLARQKLEQSERRFRHLIQSSIIGVMFWDLDKGIIDANDAFLQMLGYSRADLEKGLHWLAMTPPQWKEADDKGEADILATGHHHPFEKQYLHKNGTPVDVIIGSSAIEGTANRKGVTFVLDISERKKTEQALKESEERFRRLAETLPQMVWMRDLQGNIEYASDAWLRYSGIKNISEAWKWMVHPDDWQSVMDHWETCQRSQQSLRYEVRLRNHKGEYRWHYATGEPLKNENGAVVKWIGAILDIHEQKIFSEKLEALVAERTEALRRSNEDLQQFAHVASHDLKEPVRKIRTFGSRMRQEFETTLPQRALQYLSKMELAADRMYAMIDGVLNYSTLDAGDATITTVDLNDLLKVIVEDLELPIANKAARIHYQNLHRIKMWPVLAHQLFYNLLNNALKFSKENEPPLVHISSEMIEQNKRGANNWVRIVITDNGIGFDPAESEKIFKTFTRLNSKDKYEGTGLGLALCRKIVDRYGGSIQATGAEGAGATFTLLLPAAE